MSRFFRGRSVDLHHCLQLISAGVALGLLSWISEPAWAHHPFGGETPDSLVEGFLSGLGHPVIGLDHLVFVIATGLLALTHRQGLWIPGSFILATLIGTGMHLAELNLPAPETLISASVIAIGLTLAIRSQLGLISTIGLASGAGLFHGYAYGEAVVGAEVTPLISYLLGFALIQFLIALGAWGLGHSLIQIPNLSDDQKIPSADLPETSQSPALGLRFAGFTICGAGAAFLSSVFLG